MWGMWEERSADNCEPVPPETPYLSIARKNVRRRKEEGMHMGENSVWINFNSNRNVSDLGLSFTLCRCSYRLHSLQWVWLGPCTVSLWQSSVYRMGPSAKSSWFGRHLLKTRKSLSNDIHGVSNVVIVHEAPLFAQLSNVHDQQQIVEHVHRA